MFGPSTKKRVQGNLSSLKKEGSVRLLTVDVIEARNILVYETRRGTTDSYIRCSLLDLSDREIPSESHNTDQKKGTINPVFNNTFKFGMFSSLPILKYDHRIIFHF